MQVAGARMEVTTAGETTAARGNVHACGVTVGTAVESSGGVEMVEKPVESGKVGTLIVRVGAATVVKIPALVDSRETPVGPVEAESALGDCEHCLTDRDSIGTGRFLFLFGMPPFQSHQRIWLTR